MSCLNANRTPPVSDFFQSGGVLQSESAARLLRRCRPRARRAEADKQPVRSKSIPDPTLSRLRSNPVATSRRTAITYPDGRRIDLGYGTGGGASDRLSRVETVQILGEAQSAAAYTFVGLAQYVRIGYAEPGVERTYIKASGEPAGDAGDPYTGTDRFGRVVDLRWQTTGGSPALLDRVQWGYDRAGNRTWRRNLAAPSGQDDCYGYDGLYQVTDAARGDLNINRTAIGGIPAGEQTFTYDPTGNWQRTTTAEAGVETLDQSRVHNQDNQLTQIDGSNSGILYDRAGNALRMPPTRLGNWAQHYRLTWDAWNRLVRVQTDDEYAPPIAEYAYDGAFRRITVSNGILTIGTYYNDLWRPVEERIEGQSTPQRQYVWGARPGHRDELILQDRAADRLYCLMDYFDPTAVVDPSGAVVERYGWSAFGQRRVMDADWEPLASSAAAFDFGFHGQFLDSETGYYNYGYRYYSIEIGRWLSRDPIGESGGENFYNFTSNAPINGNDWLGLINWGAKTQVTTVPGLPDNNTDPSIVGHKYRVQTDAGKEILVWMPDFSRTNGKTIRIGDQSIVIDSNTLYWCHGFTFGGDAAPGGPFSIYGNQVPTVLADDGWVWIPCFFASKGDIVVYATDGNWGEPYHSGIIDSIATVEDPNNKWVEIFDEDNSKAKSKFGLYPEHAKIRGWVDSPSGNRLKGEYRCYQKHGKEPNENSFKCIGPGKAESWKEKWLEWKGM